MKREQEFHKNRLRSRIGFKESTSALLLFPPGRVQLYKAGERPFAMEKTRHSGWRFNRGGDLLDLREAAAAVRRSQRRRNRVEGQGELLPPAYEIRCLTKFLRTVPEGIQRELRLYHARTWQMNSFFSRCGEPAFDLSRSNRGLAFICANVWVFAPHRVQWEMRRIRSLLRKRRRHAIGSLGFPATEAAVRVLGHVTRQTLEINPILYLRQAMQDPELLARLGHLNRINPGVIRIMSDPVLLRHTSQRMVIDVSRERSFDAGGKKLVRLMEDAMGMLGPRQRETIVFQNLKHLTTTHDELAEEYRSRGPTSCVSLGAPPLPGIPGKIEPLTSSNSLWEESRELSNCLSSPNYIREVLSGRVYLYRIISPERSVVAIEKKFVNGDWSVREIRAFANREPRPEVLSVVQRWLDSRQSAPKPIEEDGWG